MSLPANKLKEYRRIGHSLHPIVMVAGNGLSDGVLAEVERALEDHELIKVKVAVVDRELRRQVIEELCTHSHAQLVQEIGKMALIFREAKKPNLRKSNIR